MPLKVRNLPNFYLPIQWAAGRFVTIVHFIIVNIYSCK